MIQAFCWTFSLRLVKRYRAECIAECIVERCECVVECSPEYSSKCSPACAPVKPLNNKLFNESMNCDAVECDSLLLCRSVTGEWALDRTLPCTAIVHSRLHLEMNAAVSGCESSTARNRGETCVCGQRRTLNALEMGACVRQIPTAKHQKKIILNWCVN